MKGIKTTKKSKSHLDPNKQNISKQSSSSNDKSMLSIVIDSNNDEKPIKEDIKSVLNQTFPDFKIAITDNSSTDIAVKKIREEEAINEYKEKEEKLKKTIQNNNKKIKNQQRSLNRIKSSKSWKITTPLRNMSKFLRKIKKNSSPQPHNRQSKKIDEINQTNKNSSLISSSDLFDEEYYVFNYGMSIKDPINHYLKKGYSRKFNPHPFFNSQWYLDIVNKNSNVKNPFIHYLEEGAKKKLDPHPMFSTKFYIKQKTSVNNNDSNYLKDYVEKGRFEGLIPSPEYVVNEKILSKIPKEYKYKYTSSPILCRVAPTLYLSSVPKRNLHHNFWDFESYYRLSILTNRLIKNPLYEEDLRIISIMDQEKEILHEKYKDKPQDELVSIIMPTHNRADSIPDAIISVISQSYQNWELIIVDDGGTDNTEEVVSRFNDDRIIYNKLNESKGSSGARNTALSMSKGPIIAYLDDDIWDPDMLLISVNELRTSEKNIVYSAQIVWRGFNQILRLGNKFGFVRFSPFNRSLIENHNYISMISLVHDRCLFEKLGGFDESLKSLEDWDLIVRYTELEFPKAIPCILNHYFLSRHNKNVSQLARAKSSSIEVYEKLINRSSYNEVLTIDNENHEIFGISEITTKKREELLLNLQSRVVEIIIPNYESKFLLKRCLESIIEHTKVPYNILICDNNSSKETQKFIDEMCQEYDNVNWIDVNENQGFSHAVNAGLKIAFKKKNDILILNNDVIVTPNWLEEMLLVLDENKDVGMVTSRQVLLKENKIIKYHVPSAYKFFEVDINLSAHHHNIMRPFDTDKFELNFTPFFCVLIRYEDAISVGYLDAKNGPHFRSDNIYSDIFRRKTDKKIVYTPYSKVYHMQGVSTKTLIKNKGKDNF